MWFVGVRRCGFLYKAVYLLAQKLRASSSQRRNLRVFFQFGCMGVCCVLGLVLRVSLQHSISTSPIVPGAECRNPEICFFFHFSYMGVCGVSGLRDAGVSTVYKSSISTSPKTPGEDRRNPNSFFIIFQFDSLVVFDMSGLGVSVQHSISTTPLTSDAERSNP